MRGDTSLRQSFSSATAGSLSKCNIVRFEASAECMCDVSRRNRNVIHSIIHPHTTTPNTATREEQNCSNLSALCALFWGECVWVGKKTRDSSTRGCSFWHIEHEGWPCTHAPQAACDVEMAYKGYIDVFSTSASSATSTLQRVIFTICLFQTNWREFATPVLDKFFFFFS